MEGTCPSGHANPPGQRFCGECGAALDATGPLLPPGPPSSEGGPRPAGKRWIAVAVAVVVGGGLLAGGILLWSGSQGEDEAASGGPDSDAGEVSVEATRFENAYESCSVTSVDIEVADEGTSIIMDGPPDTSARMGEFISDLACIMDALHTPEYVMHNMESTTSLMGLQEAEWDGIHAQWSYHPDNGLDLVLNEQ